METTNLIFMVLVFPLIVPTILSAHQHDGKQVPMAKFCSGCHEPEPGLMMGFLENISYKAKTIQMNFVTHKDLVKRLKDLPRDKNIVFYCPNGVRAEMAYNTLKNLGRDSRYLNASISIDKKGDFKITQN